MCKVKTQLLATNKILLGSGHFKFGRFQKASKCSRLVYFAQTVLGNRDAGRYGLAQLKSEKPLVKK
jgi:hypothetical protein